MNKEPFEDALHFVSFCNKLDENSSDHAIADVVFSHADDIGSLTIESISGESSISTSSVSRFFARAGFDKFSTFKSEFAYYLKSAGRFRTKEIFRDYPGYGWGSAVEDDYRRMIANLAATRNSLDQKKIAQVTDYFLNSNGVVFIGDTRDLDAFTVVQLDLLSMGKAAYMKNISQVKMEYLQRLKQDLTLCFLSVNSGWYGDRIAAIASSAGKKNWHTVLFAQDEEACTKDIECFIKYGIQASNNDGYVSLLYLSDLLSIMLYKVQ